MPRPIPNIIHDINNLKLGDILIFRSDPLIDPTFEQKAIAFFQSLTRNKEDGHSYSTHAGICVGRNDNQQSMIAHVTDTENPKIIEYIKEPLENYMAREKSNRPFLIFRPKVAFISDRIAEMAGKAQESFQQHITWEYSSAAQAIFSELGDKSSSQLNKKVSSKINLEEIAQFDPSISISTHCSKFVVEIINQATHNQLHKHLDVESSCSVKYLEHALYQDELQYELIYYPGIHCPYEVLKEEIIKQLNHVKQRDDLASQQKYEACYKVYLKMNTALDQRGDMNALQKADYLLLALDGLLAINTGYNLKKSGSHEKIIELAQRFCLFHHEIHIPLNTRNMPDKPIPVSESTYQLHAKK